jgi:pyochelin biosynthetic protein PchC
MRPERNPWFRRHTARAPSVRLVCFAHAGGSASLFHGWRALLPDHVELLAVQYPGRQDRLFEPCAETMEELAESALKALEPELGLPFALFGHSMGAAVAHELTRLLERRGEARPRRLFVSGRGAQHVIQDQNVPGITDAAIMGSVRELGGPGLAAYDDPELRDVLLPPLLADYRLLNRYLVTGPARLRTPISAYGGADDPVCSVEELCAWGDCTEEWSGTHVFPGGHFYLVPGERELVARIARELG